LNFKTKKAFFLIDKKVPEILQPYINSNKHLEYKVYPEEKNLGVKKLKVNKIRKHKQK